MAMSPYEMYPIPDITVEEKPMEFRCTVCDKPYYADRKKLAKHMGCQCAVPTPPLPEPITEAKATIETWWC